MVPMRLRRLALAAAIASLAAASACGGGGKPAALIIYEANTAGVVNIFTIDPTTAASKQITHGDAFDGNPAWSPDRKHIIFSSNRNQEDARMNEILVMDADGRNVRNLTNTEKGSEWSPKYSPDGARIAYAITTGDGAYHLGLMDADGSNPQEVAGPYRFVEFPSWTRDGREVFFSAIALESNDVDIYSIDVATKDVRTRISTPAADLCPHFTHDGKSMTYATVDPAQGYGGNVDVFRHDLASDDTTAASDERITDADGSDDYANPSPDDRSFVFITNRDGNFEMYLMDADGSNPRRLTNTPDTRENVPDW